MLATQQTEPNVALPERPAFFFSGPTRTLIAEDEGAILDVSLRDRERVLTGAERLLREGSRWLVGAVPFSEHSNVRLFCPTRVVERGRFWVDPSTLPERTPSSRSPTTSVMRSEQGFLKAVSEAVQAIRSGELDKVVLARTEDRPVQRSPNVANLLRVLHARNPHGFTYALALPRDATESGERASKTLVGASPELLISRRGTRFVTAPLAGSLPRGKTPEEDRRNARDLLRSSKDLHEHRIVVEHIMECLRPFTRELLCEAEPIVIATRNMLHLSTRIEGKLPDREVSSLRLALALHPTPAVCGVPTERAHAFIQRVEDFDRGFFTGTLGYMDASGDGDWIVTIRCAELGPSRVRVFAGAGIVESSVPELELAETSAKMTTMLEAIGVTEEDS